MTASEKERYKNALIPRVIKGGDYPWYLQNRNSRWYAVAFGLSGNIWFLRFPPRPSLGQCPRHIRRKSAESIPHNLHQEVVFDY